MVRSYAWINIKISPTKEMIDKINVFFFFILVIRDYAISCMWFYMIYDREFWCLVTHDCCPYFYCFFLISCAKWIAEGYLRSPFCSIFWGFSWIIITCPTCKIQYILNYFVSPMPCCSRCFIGEACWFLKS